MARGYARAEEKNQAVREALEPLAPGERPGAVTLGAIFSGLIALIFWGSVFVRLFTDIKIEGSEPDPIQLAVFAAVMTAMAIGMWRVRYWAVLGFQMLLVLFLVAATAGLLTAQTLLQAIFTTLLIFVVGFLFYRMIKAMARIQMPTRHPPP
jgi:Na+/glutamate symporter